MKEHFAKQESSCPHLGVSLIYIFLNGLSHVEKKGGLDIGGPPNRKLGVKQWVKMIIERLFYV